MRYKLAVFDMDGTILNTLEDLADSTNYALKRGLFRQIPSRNLLMKFLKHSKNIIKHIVP